MPLDLPSPGTQLPPVPASDKDNLAPIQRSEPNITATLNPLSTAKLPTIERQETASDRSILLRTQTALKVSLATLKGGLSLSWEGSKVGTCINGASAIVEAANPIVSGLLVMSMIDAITLGTGPRTAVLAGAAAFCMNVFAAALRSVSVRESAKLTDDIEKFTERKISQNLAARYEELFGSEKNSTVVMLRENMWRIKFLPDTALSVVTVVTSCVAAGFALTGAPWQILAGAAVVAMLPTINQLIQAKQLHRDEQKIANTRRKYWYQNWAIKYKESLRELMLLGARDEMAEKSENNLTAIHAQQRKRTWGYMARELISTPGGAALTVGSTAYMYWLYTSTKGTPSAISLGEVSFVLTSTLPLMMHALSRMGSTFGKAFEASPFYSAYVQLSKRVPEAELTKEAVRSSKTISPPTLRLHNLAFSYDTSSELPDVLCGVNLEVKPGEFLGIVGPVGAGKSTLFELLCGIRKPTAGTVQVDGEPLTLENRPEWISKIGFVFQDPYRFNSLTLREFLLLGNKNVDENFLGLILEKTGLNEILSRSMRMRDGTTRPKFPLGLETPMGEEFEGGKAISGGEIQLLSICRALLRKPAVLFLDEPTANLHPTHRRRIRELIEQRESWLGYKPTVVMISHDYRSVRKADRIIFVDESVQGILETGTHAELIQISGRYSKEVQAEMEE